MTCENEDCNNTTTEGYKYCQDCYKKWKQSNLDKGAWHDNETIDQLMKINSNLGKIARTLENWEEANYGNVEPDAEE